jgi:orotate phosphoribosyltransferase-like protein
VNAHVEDFVQRLADLQAKGLDVSAMARELGVSREAIYKRRRGARTWAVNS